MSFYHTTTAASASEVVTKMLDFCTAKGWSKWQDVDLGNRWVVQGSGQPIEIWSSGDYVYLRGVYSGSPNVSAAHNSYMRLYGYQVSEMHMMAYDDPDVMYFVFKLSNGGYRQAVLGECQKIGTWTGGTMCYISSHLPDGSSYSNYFPTSRHGNHKLFSGYAAMGGIYCDNGESNNWRPFYRGSHTGGSYSAAGHGDNWGGTTYYNRSNYYDQQYYLWGSSESSFNWSTHLIPFTINIGRPDGLQSPAGFAPHIRVTKGAAIFPDQVGNIGGDQWRFFPIIKKAAPSSSAAGSYNYFYAFYIDTGMNTPVIV